MSTTPAADANAPLRRSIYGILICIGIGAMVGRILAVDSVDRRGQADGKFQKELDETQSELEKQGVSGLDLYYALARAKTYLAVSSGLWRPFLSANDRSRWCTVRALVEPDMQVPGAPYAIDTVVDNPGWDTIDKVRRNDHFYSSKPPLLSTLMAGEYWLIYHATGWSLGTHPYEIGRFMMITINGACLLLLFLSMTRLVERLGTTDWGRILVMASCVFGTFLTTFEMTITNHLPAAACAAVLLDALVRIWFDDDRRMRTFLVAGFFSAMLGAMEIPAAALSAAVSLIVFFHAPRKTLLAYLPPALLVTAAFFGTNWIAVHSLTPPQMHRSGNDDWYDYKDSYWHSIYRERGIDKGEASAAVYSLHTLVGHHGIFSLTPIWLLSLLGIAIWLYGGHWPVKLYALLSLAITLICLTFYIWWPTVDRNYSGNSSGFRWVFWLAPLWLVLMLPAADLLSYRRWSRAVGLVLLALSVLSVSYPTWNAWGPPWIMNFMGYMGWL